MSWEARKKSAVDVVSIRISGVPRVAVTPAVQRCCVGVPQHHQVQSRSAEGQNLRCGVREFHRNCWLAVTAAERSGSVSLLQTARHRLSQLLSQRCETASAAADMPVALLAPLLLNCACPISRCWLPGCMFYVLCVYSWPCYRCHALLS